MLKGDFNRCFFNFAATNQSIMKFVSFIVFAFFTLVAHAQQKPAPSAVGFLENKGQITDQYGKPNPQVKYLLNTPGLNVQIRENGFSYDFYKVSEAIHKVSRKQNFDSLQATATYKVHRIDIDFKGINKMARLVAKDKSVAFFNYYTVAAASATVNVYAYSTIVVEDIYPNIDLIYEIPEDSRKPFEYNFIIKEGGNITDIQFTINGAKAEVHNESLLMHLRFGAAKETIPASWAETENGKLPLKISYRKVNKNTFGFLAPDGTVKGKIVVDPVPVRLWGSYAGGSGSSFPGIVKTDSQNNVFITGSTASRSNIATAGTFRSVYIEQSSSNGYLQKFTPGGALIWGTYYFVNVGFITIDPNFNVVCVRNTSTASNMLVTSGSFQLQKRQYSDGLITKFNANGQRLWSTYYGGDGNDDINGVATDDNSNIYICGETESISLYTTTTSHQQHNGGGNDGFLARFTPGGQLDWATFYGGTAADGFSSVAIYNGAVIVGGILHNGGLHAGTGVNPYQGTADIFVAQFSLAGTLQRGTYIGGPRTDYLNFMKVFQDKVYIAGRTANQMGIATPGSLYPNYVVANGDVVASTVLCVDLQTSAILWGTYFSEMINDIDVTSTGNVLISGYTTTNTGITTPGSYMETKDNYSKSFLIKFDDLGQRVWGTYYGGDGAEQIAKIAVDGLNDIYMLGISNGSLNGISTPGAHQETISPTALMSAYLVKFRDCNSFSTATVSNNVICPGGTITFSAQGGTGYAWTGPNGFTSSLPNPVINNAGTTHTGLYNCTITGTPGCDATISLNVTVADTQPPVPVLVTLPDITAVCSTTVSQVPQANDACEGLINGVAQGPVSFTVPGNYVIDWKYTDRFGNFSVQQQNVIITVDTSIVVPQDVVLRQCAGAGTFNLLQAEPLITSAAGIFSYFPTATDALNGTNSITTPGNYSVTTNTDVYVILQIANGCKFQSVVHLVFDVLPVATNVTLQRCFAQQPYVFNLNGAKSLIDAQNEYSITFFASAADLLNNLPIADITSYTITNTSTAIEAKVTNASGCSVTVQVQLVADTITMIPLQNRPGCLPSDGGPVTFVNATLDQELALLLPADTYTFKYYDDLNEAVQGSNNTINSWYVFYAPGSHTVYYRAQGTSGCPYLFTQKLVAFEYTEIDMEDEYFMCPGNPLTITLPTGYDYEWGDGHTGNTATFTHSGYYTVTATQVGYSSTCIPPKGFEIKYSELPVMNDIVTSDFNGTDNTITILPYNADYLYSLDGVTYQQDNVFTGLKSGIYNVYVTNKSRCMVLHSKAVVLMYPKFFTPNNDGNNDYWHIKNSATEDMVIYIFDRYGKLLTSLTETDKGWDGTFNGNPMPANDYWFVIYSASHSEIKGHFSLIR